jgi:SAM-dependent methyltransferase
LHQYGGYKDLPLLAEVYDAANNAMADTDFYIEAAAERPRVLELGCGTGRVLIPLAESGARVTGLDVSEHMLRRCREKLAGLPDEVQARTELIPGDMSDFDLNEQFDLVVVPFRAFQHLLTVEAQLGCLRSVHKHLKGSGRLIVDVFLPNPAILSDPNSLEECLGDRVETLPDGREVRRAWRFSAVHPAEQINDVELIFYVTHPDGHSERLVQAFPMRYFYRYEFEHLLARGGFRVAELYGDFEKTPLRDDSPEMIFVAEKDL